MAKNDRSLKKISMLRVWASASWLPHRIRSIRTRLCRLLGSSSFLKSRNLNSHWVREIRYLVIQINCTDSLGKIEKSDFTTGTFTHSSKMSVSITETTQPNSVQSVFPCPILFLTLSGKTSKYLSTIQFKMALENSFARQTRGFRLLLGGRGAEGGNCPKSRTVK